MIKSLAKSVLPLGLRQNMRRLVRPLVDSDFRRQRRMMRERRRRHDQLARMLPQLYADAQGKVQQGPFAGLTYVKQSVGSAWVPKLMGTYEMELRPVVELIITGDYDTLVDIGAAEGYYAVGIARAKPDCRIVCFEAQTDTHSVLREFARINNVTQAIDLQGLCTSKMLGQALSTAERAVVICDIEGAERDLLDPMQVPDLTRVDILVELHHFVHGDVEQVLRQRFSPTHDIQAIASRTRTPGDFPKSLNVAESQRLLCMNEDRPDEMTWLWMTRRR